MVSGQIFSDENIHQWTDYKIYFKSRKDRNGAFSELTNDEWKFYFSYQSKAIVL
jgi:hypothetical protein